jgi:HCOMODA/2-hydroxy-3-carboxy-muconic semialdehyde decarboxylase
MARDDSLDRTVRVAARALGRAGLAHAYGHCSARIDREHFLVCAPRPMGLVGVGEPNVEVPIEGELPAQVLGEVRVHQAIYRRRGDVGGICRVQPPATMALSTLRLTPRARHGFSAYFAPAPPLWDDPMLVRSNEGAIAVAEELGDASAVVLRGNGAITVGSDLQHAAVLAWYLEDSARLELSVRSASSSDGAEPIELSVAEAEARATWDGGLAERMWDYLTAGDPELSEHL